MYKEFIGKAKEIVAKMTLKEKIGQLNQINIIPYEKDMEKLHELIRNGQVGSLILANSSTAGNDAQGHVNVELYNELQKIAVNESRLGIPMIYGRDVIHGHRTVYPLPLASAAAFNDELLEKCYRNIAEEAAADGIHWTFSPMLDTCHDARWGRIVEGPGEDPFVGVCMAKATIKGFQGDDLTDKRSIAACAKHFLGYGFCEGGRDYSHTEISNLTIQNLVLPAFRAATDEGVATFMSSFNNINGTPATANKKYLTDVLRGQLGFDGFVVSDWGSIGHQQVMGVAENRRECAKNAINAGLDLDMVIKCYLENLESLVEDGEVSVETIDTAVERILCVKLAIGLFDRPYRERFSYDKQAHLNDAKALASEAMVLLKNDGVLPLKKDGNIALLGPFVNEKTSLMGTWTLDGEESDVTAFGDAVKKVMTGGMLCEDENDAAFDKTDVVLLALGESRDFTGENHSVADISLEKSQIELIEKMHSLGKKVVGVFFCGRPLALEEVEENLDAILYAWHSGSRTSDAAADILFGDVVPSGKTAITFPRRATHVPIYYNFYPNSHSVDNYYGKGWAASYMDSKAWPLYPFGYGLSYTKFEYGKLSADKEKISLDELKQGGKVKVSISVSNVGDFDSKETVQLYIHDKVALVMRPLRELKGYKKVFIKQNQTVKVDFDLTYKDLGFYTEDGEYLVEKGEFEIFVGENCLTGNKINLTVE